MEFKGTKGKWRIKHSQTKEAFNIIGSIAGEKFKIARCPYINQPNLSKQWNKKEKQEAKADALLISKAPEMLEILQECRTQLVLCTLLDKSGQCSKMVEEIEQLIKEATEL